MFRRRRYRIIRERGYNKLMKAIKSFLRAVIVLFLFVSLSGCSGLEVKRDSEGRIMEITQKGIFPVKGKIHEASLDTKLSIIDLDISGVKEGD